MKTWFWSLMLVSLQSYSATKPFEELLTSMAPLDTAETLDSTYSDPLYKKLQLEYRTGGSDSVELNGASRVSLKLSPLAWGQMGKEKELRREYEAFQRQLNREGSSRECLYRGSVFNDAYHAKKALHIVRGLKANLEDEVKLLRKGVGENLFELKQLISVQESLAKNGLLLRSLEKRVLSIERTLAERLGRPVTLEDISFRNFIDVRKVKRLGAVSEPKKVELQKLENLASIQKLELDIERREAEQVFDSVQLIRWDEAGAGEASYGFQVTFNLPVFNKKTYLKDSVQRQLAINKLTLAKKELASEIKGTELEFVSKIENFEALRDSDYLKTLKTLMRLLRGSKNNSPLLILQTKSKIAQERLKVLDLKKEIIADYLNRLYHAGGLDDCGSSAFLVRN